MSEIPPSVPPSAPPPPGGGSYAPPPPPPGASSDRTLMLVLSYLGILALIPMIVKKEDREVQWHAKNGLVIFVAYIIVVIAWSIFNNFLPAGIGCALSFIGCALWLGYLAVVVLAIMKALKGERFVIPGLSDLAGKF